jgi:uncharacterized membrane protein YczE
MYMPNFSRVELVQLRMRFRHYQDSLVVRWAQLIFGFFLFGIAIALMVRSELGLGPWDAFHQGIDRLTGISIGGASIIVGFLILVAGFLFGIRPGPGTVANMIFIGIFTDLILPVIPAAAGWTSALVYYVLAVGLSGFATGLYIAAGLGKGPRDGLMIALSQRTGWPVRRVRSLMELSVLALGWAMGGTIGLGTLIFAGAIGPVTQWSLELFGIAPKPAAATGKG